MNIKTKRKIEYYGMMVVYTSLFTAILLGLDWLLEKIIERFR